MWWCCGVRFPLRWNNVRCQKSSKMASKAKRRKPRVIDDSIDLVLVRSKRTVKVSSISPISNPSTERDPHQRYEQRERTELEPTVVFDCEPGTSSNYEEKREKSFSSWRDLHADLVAAGVESNAMPCDQPCVQCALNEEETVATIRCKDCSFDAFFCEECALKEHIRTNRLHFLEQWRNGMFVVYDRGPPVYQLPVGLSHDSICKHYNRFVTVLCLNGLQKNCLFNMCTCTSECKVLVRHGFWPASPQNPKTAFTMDLMQHLEALFLECKVSLVSFLTALERLDSNLAPHLIKKITTCLNSDSFAEFRFFKYKLRYLKDICPDLDHSCLACPKANGAVFLSFDACFGLHRRRKQGTLNLPSRHGDLMIVDQLEVEQYLEKYPIQSKTKDQDKECNDFHAGSASSFTLMTGGKDRFFDEKAIFGSVCKHQFPVVFLNLKHGKRLAYCVLLMEKLLEQRKSGGLEFKFFYDIACKLSSHLKRTGNAALLKNVDLMLPSFHAYAHTPSCQMKYASLYIDGSGYSDGEQCERLWSYLRGFCAITKQMTVGNRNDALTDALLYYGRNSITKLGPLLTRRVQQTSSVGHAAEIELAELLKGLSKSAGTAVSEEIVKIWQSELLEKTSKSHSETVAESDNWRESYVSLLLQHAKLSSFTFSNKKSEEEMVGPMVKKLSLLENKLKRLEKEQNIKRRWSLNDGRIAALLVETINKKRKILVENLRPLAFDRWFLLTLKQKYCDGQKLARTLRRAIDGKVAAMKKLVQDYNAEVAVGRKAGLKAMRAVDVNDCFSLQCPLYNITDEGNQNQDFPLEVKRKAVDLMLTVKRRKEEEHYCIADMNTAIMQIKEKREKLTNAIDCFDGHDLYDSGARILLKSHLLWVNSVGYNLAILFATCNEGRYNNELFSEFLDSLKGEPLCIDDLKVLLDEAESDIEEDEIESETEENNEHEPSNSPTADSDYNVDFEPEPEYFL